MGGKAWMHGIGLTARSRNDQLAAALQRCGVSTCTHQTAHNGNAGIVLFDQADAELLRFIHDTCTAADRRVLAVCATEVPLDAETAWSLTAAGAADVLDFGESCDELATHLAARITRWGEIDQLLALPMVRDNLVGQSEAWRTSLRALVEAARFSGGSALITGESGVGKELAARLIHSLDGRQDKGELVILDCTTVVPDLAGSEFFGHERGAFTGALSARDGAFALADGGTLFLDEIGELPLPLQAQLLRVIQEGRYKRVGGNQWRDTRFRLICATNRDMSEEVAAGRFRGDLYYRLASCCFRLPALRDRPEDILLLAEHFLRQSITNASMPAFSEPVKACLLTRRYPGNIRELRQLMAWIGARHVGDGPITVGDIPEAERPTVAAPDACWDDERFEVAIRRALSLGVGLKDIGQTATEAAIRIAVSEEDGNLQKAARRLGVTDRTLQIRRANQRK